MPKSLLIDFQTFLIAMALVTPRAFVCLMIVPGFSTKTLTGMAKNSVAFAIALPAILPTFYFVQETPPDFLLAGALAIKEAMIGGFLGVLLAIPVWVVQSIGAILDSQRSPIQIQASASADQDAGVTGSMLVQAVVLVLIQAGLFVAMTRIIIESYGVWPAFNLTPPFEHGHLDLLIKRFSEFFWHIAVYGGPMLIPLIMVDFAFAILGVFASNLQVSFASSPIKSLLGMFIVFVYWPTLSHWVVGDFAHILDFAAEMIQASPISK